MWMEGLERCFSNFGVCMYCLGPSPSTVSAERDLGWGLRFRCSPAARGCLVGLFGLEQRGEDPDTSTRQRSTMTLHSGMG